MWNSCKDCYYYDYRELCPGCAIERCLVDSCLRGVSFSGITYPKSFCKLRAYCPIGGRPRPPPVLLPYSRKKDMPKINFPSFVPQIDIGNRGTWFWEEGIDAPAIFVPLWQLILNGDLLSETLSKGLHDFLNFNGKILLSTVMPDELIDKLTKDDYLKLIKELRPDATMIPDNYTYIDVPLYQSWSQTMRLISLANDFLDLDIPLIGLIKGANLRQIYMSLKREIEMNYVSFVMPARELFEQGLLNDLLSHVLIMLKKLGRVNNKKLEILIYGVGRKLGYKGISYSNFSWFLEAKHGLYFRDGKLYDMRDEKIRFKECYCDACKGKMPQDLINLWVESSVSCKRILALHNLLDWLRRSKSWAGGSLIKQYESRFREGEQVLTERKGEWEECHKEAYREVMDFGEYKVGVTESGGYELLRGNNVISTFAEARIEEDRIEISDVDATEDEVLVDLAVFEPKNLESNTYLF